MKPQKILFSVLLFFVFIPGQGQSFNHFPQKQAMLFMVDRTYDSLFHQVYFDSSYYDYMEGDSGKGRLWDMGKQRPGECNMNWFFLNGSNPSNSFIQHYSFSAKGPVLEVSTDSRPLVHIRLDVPDGSAFDGIADSLWFEGVKWYSKEALSDSAYCFYPFRNGAPDMVALPIVYGKTRGWISVGEFASFRQVGYFENNSYTGPQPVSWKSFYPERSGDVKLWRNTSPTSNVGGFRSDSFLAVVVFPDSIQFTVSRRTFKVGTGWSVRSIINYTIRSSDEVGKALQNENFGRVWLREDSTSQGNYVYLQIEHAKKPSWQTLSFIAEYLGSPNDPCVINRVADWAEGRKYDSRLGMTMDIRSDFFGIGEELAAYKVGPYAAGAFNVSMEERPSELGFYPNPTAGQLFFPEDVINGHYTIRNMEGQVIEEGILEENTLSVDDLKNGMYLIVVEGAGYRKQGRFVRLN